MRTPIRKAFFVMCLAALQAQAAQVCNDTETWFACYQRINAIALAESAAQEQREATERTAVESTAAKTATDLTQAAANSDAGPGVAMTQRDFISRLFTSLSLGEVSEAGGALTLNWLPEVLEELPLGPISLRSVVHKPEPFGALGEKLTDGKRTDLKESLTRELTDLDDVEYSATWRILGKQADVATEAVSQAFNELLQKAKRSATIGVDSPPQRWREHVDAHKTLLTTLVGVTREKDPKLAEETSRVIEDLTSYLGHYKRAVTSLRSESPYSFLAELASNAPQAYVEVILRQREGVAGPDASSAKATIEWSNRTIRSMMRSCPPDLPIVDCARDKRDSFEPPKAWRLAGSFEYSMTRAFAYTEAAPAPGATAFTYSAPESRKRSALLTLGRALPWGGLGHEGSPNSRFALEVRYDDVSGDEQQNDRLLGTLTLSQRISASASTASFSLVYANRPEFRGEVDAQLSMRAGLRFKLDSDEE